MTDMPRDIWAHEIGPPNNKERHGLWGHQDFIIGCVRYVRSDAEDPRIKAAESLAKALGRAISVIKAAREKTAVQITAEIDQYLKEWDKALQSYKDAGGK